MPTDYKEAAFMTGLIRTKLASYLLTKEAQDDIDSSVANVKNLVSKALGAGIPIASAIYGAHRAGKAGESPVSGALKWGIPGLALGLLTRSLGPTDREMEMATLGKPSTMANVLNVGRILGQYPEQATREQFLKLQEKSQTIQGLKDSISKMKSQFMSGVANPLEKSKMALSISKADYELAKMRSEIHEMGKTLSGKLGLIHEITSHV